MKKITTLVLMLIFSVGNSQVGIGTTTPEPSSILDIHSTEKGLLIPRLTIDERDNINNPVDGLMLYQTDNSPGFYFYNGTIWSAISSASDYGFFIDATGGAFNNQVFSEIITWTTMSENRGSSITLENNRINLAAIGRYSIELDVAYFNTTNNRSIAETCLSLDGITCLPRSSIFTYHRTNTLGEQSGTLTYVFNNTSQNTAIFILTRRTLGNQMLDLLPDGIRAFVKLL